MVQRYILLWLVLSSGVALFWPQAGLAGDPFLVAGRTAINVLIPVVMFCVGILLPVDEVRQLGRRWPTVLIGTAVQYTAMPLLAWLMVRLFRPAPDLATGIMIVGCVPGAMASNVLTMIAKGNVSYSVSLTTSATLLSPLVVPATLWLTLGKEVQYNAVDAVRLLIVQVVVPVLVGHGLTRLCSTRQDSVGKAFRIFSEQGASTLANVAILTIIAVVVALNRDSFGTTGLSVLPALVIINACGYQVGFLAARQAGMSAAMQRALTLEVGMQNAGAGASIALNLFPNSSAAVPCVLYTFGCMLTGTLLAQYWSRRPVVFQ
ncbi:MAG: bile acid:sodium symporter family protein [Planctomycetaceae bacterium]|nr:bile acid:sodium symporter family protein [Planctomycetaceae bacterium]